MGILVRGVDPGVISEMRAGAVLSICGGRDRQVFSLGILVYFCEGLLGVTGGYEGWIWVWIDLGEGVSQESVWVLALVPWLDEDMRICGRGI